MGDHDQSEDTNPTSEAASTSQCCLELMEMSAAVPELGTTTCSVKHLHYLLVEVDGCTFADSSMLLAV